MKKLDIEREIHEPCGAIVYRLGGDLLDSKEAYALLDKVREELKKGCPLVLVNLQDIRYLSSSGIGILAACYTSAKKTGGRFALAGASEAAERILKLVCLWDAIERFDSEEEGIRSVSGEA